MLNGSRYGRGFVKQEKKRVQQRPPARVAEVRLTRRRLTLFLVLAVAAAVVPWVLYLSARQGMPRGQGRPAASPSISVRPGPWGDLKITRMQTELPLDYVRLDDYKDLNRRWVFRGYTSVELQKLLDAAGLTLSQRQSLLAGAQHEASVQGFVIWPESNVVLGISPGARERLYAALAASPDNTAQFSPLRYPAEAVDEWMDEEGVAPDTIAAVRKLLYTRGSCVVFSDMAQVLDMLKSDDAKAHMIKMVSQQSSLMVKLQVRPHQDVTELAKYWSGPGRPRTAQPLLESLAKLNRGGEVDIVELLPPFPRRLMYRYPDKGAYDPRVDCHWTSLNFWNDQPDNRYLDLANVRRDLQTLYAPVSGPAMLGDIILFTISGGDVIHSAVCIADDIVLSKNGASGNSPWILTELGRLEEYYRCTHPSLQLKYMRLK